MSGRSPSSAVLTAIAAAAPLLSAALLGSAGAPKPAKPPATPEPPKRAPFAPITYFNTTCASCHGPYGAAFGPTFGRGLTDHALKDKVEEMVFGPSQSTLQPDELDQLTAYHRSLVRKSPFVSVAERKADRLAGEVTPGSTIRVQFGDRIVQADVTGHTWTVRPPAKPGGAAPILLVTGPAPGPDGKPVETRVDLAKGSWSHSEPIEEKPRSDGPKSGS